MFKNILYLNLLALLCLSGCSFGPPQADYASLGLVEISGTISLDGKPLPDATIYFHNKEERVYSSGVTDANGRYQLRFDSNKTGIMPGEKTIEIVSSAAVSENIGDGEGADPSAKRAGSERLPARYNSQSTLTYTVTKTDDQVNFDLQSD